MANNHGLRTTGTHTGNFGRAKIQAKRDTLDISKVTMTKENLSIPDRDEAFRKLQLAHDTTTDPRMKATLAEMLRARAVATAPTKVKPMEKPSSEHWDEIRRTR